MVLVQSHNPFSTIREALRFSGRLRLPHDVSNEHIESHVDYVLDLLDIRHLQHEIIGMPGFGGVSPDIRKKTSMGVELMMEPQLLFLDEVRYEAVKSSMTVDPSPISLL